jgi:carnosine synthase
MGVRRLPQSRYRRMQPDSSPGSKVETIEDAMRLERNRKGSLEVGHSPKSWASPVPWRKRTSEASSLDFELNIEEDADASSYHLLDTDGPLYLEARVKSRSKFEVEQLLASPGNLPRPMTSKNREDVIRSVMPTATHELLAKLPPQLLTAQTEQTQLLRRKLAKGSTMVFISAGLPGKRFTFQRAAALGIKCVIIEHPDSWSASMAVDGTIAKFIPVDMTQSSDAVFQQALQHVQALASDPEIGSADGIATFVELSVPLVSRLCEALGLPGHRPSCVDAARDKHCTRAAMAAAGLPTPRNMLIHKPSELMAAGQHVRFPAVLKPVSGAASLGVKKVCSMDELQKCYSEVVEELSTLVISSGALIKGDPSSTSGVTAANSVDLTLLLEQYLDGTEVDVDVVMSNGEWVYAAVSDNGPTLEPYFNETWAASPSLLPREQQVALKEMAVGCVKALGFESGVFHVECKYTSSGPQLIEVNARMGGGQVHECNLQTWGVDLVEETLFAALGIPAGPMVQKKTLSGIAYCYMNAKRSGKVVSTNALAEIAKREGVVWAKPLVVDGASVVGPQDGLPTWLADLVVKKPTAREALDFLFQLEAEEPVQVE